MLFLLSIRRLAAVRQKKIYGTYIRFALGMPCSDFSETPVVNLKIA